MAASSSPVPAIPLDRLQGMFAGALLGDALGAPHKYSKFAYTGHLEHTIQVRGRTQIYSIPHGRGTDNTEIVMALLRNVLQKRGYTKMEAIKVYLAWGASNSPFIRRHHKKLFQAVMTVKGYEGRHARIASKFPSARPTFNESLVRIPVLVLFWNNDPVTADVDITSPCPINHDCSLVYISALRLALQGVDGRTIFDLVRPMAQTPQLREIFVAIESKADHPGRSRDDCLDTMWCAMTVLYYGMTHNAAMTWLISDSYASDKATNAFVTGALLGAMDGWATMQSQPTTASNLDILLSYHPDFTTHMAAAHTLMTQL